jgi:hypothetical protein
MRSVFGAPATAGFLPAANAPAPAPGVNPHGAGAGGGASGLTVALQQLVAKLTRDIDVAGSDPNALADLQTKLEGMLSATTVPQEQAVIDQALEKVKAKLVALNAGGNADPNDALGNLEDEINNPPGGGGAGGPGAGDNNGPGAGDNNGPGAGGNNGPGDFHLHVNPFLDPKMDEDQMRTEIDRQFLEAGDSVDALQALKSNLEDEKIVAPEKNELFNEFLEKIDKKLKAIYDGDESTRNLARLINVQIKQAGDDRDALVALNIELEDQLLQTTVADERDLIKQGLDAVLKHQMDLGYIASPGNDPADSDGPGQFVPPAQTLANMLEVLEMERDIDNAADSGNLDVLDKLIAEIKDPALIYPKRTLEKAMARRAQLTVGNEVLDEGATESAIEEFERKLDQRVTDAGDDRTGLQKLGVELTAQIKATTDPQQFDALNRVLDRVKSLLDPFALPLDPLSGLPPISPRAGTAVDEMNRKMDKRLEDAGDDMDRLLKLMAELDSQVKSTTDPFQIGVLKRGLKKVGAHIDALNGNAGDGGSDQNFMFNGRDIRSYPMDDTPESLKKYRDDILGYITVNDLQVMDDPDRELIEAQLNAVNWAIYDDDDTDAKESEISDLINVLNAQDDNRPLIRLEESLDMGLPYSDLVSMTKRQMAAEIIKFLKEKKKSKDITATM